MKLKQKVPFGIAAFKTTTTHLYSFWRVSWGDILFPKTVVVVGKKAAFLTFQWTATCFCWSQTSMPNENGHSSVALRSHIITLCSTNFYWCRQALAFKAPRNNFCVGKAWVVLLVCLSKICKPRSLVVILRI